MLIRGRPLTMPTPDPTTGEESDVAFACILMDDEHHICLGSGWYWARLEAGGNVLSPELWRTAVRERRGPADHVDDAFLAAQTVTVESIDLAGRLDAAARGVRMGRIEPTVPKVLEYMDRAAEMDAERRREPDKA